MNSRPAYTFEYDWIRVSQGAVSINLLKDDPRMELLIHGSKIMQTLDALQWHGNPPESLVAYRPRASAKVHPQAWWKCATILLTQNERLFTD